MKVAFDAVVALCRAIPHCRALEVAVECDGSPMVRVCFNTDEAALAAAEMFDVELTWASSDGSRWLRGNVARPDFWLGIYGPHHDRVEVKHADESVVRAAIEQVNAAIEVLS